MLLLSSPGVELGIRSRTATNGSVGLVVIVSVVIVVVAIIVIIIIAVHITLSRVGVCIAGCGNGGMTQAVCVTCGCSDSKVICRRRHHRRWGIAFCLTRFLLGGSYSCGHRRGTGCGRGVMR